MAKHNNYPPDGSLCDCRFEGCEKTFKTYSGRYNHEKKFHDMHGGNDGTKMENNTEQEKTENQEDEKEIETNNVMEIEIDDQPLVPRKIDEDGFPSIDTEKFKENVIENVDGGPLYLLITSVARVLTVVGDEDYLDALKPVEKDLKRACGKMTGSAIGKMEPWQQVLLLTLIAWIPLILMDLPNFITKFKSIKTKIGGNDDK